VSICVAAVWLAGLTSLAILSANPVTLNVRQIHDARYVISAVLTKRDGGIIVPQKEWKHGEQLPPLRIDNLDQVRFDPGVTYLVPLSPSDAGGYRVSATPLSDKRPLVYPATAEAIEQLEAALQQLKRRKAP
jgi:hypothetical protein